MSLQKLLLTLVIYLSLASLAFGSGKQDQSANVSASESATLTTAIDKLAASLTEGYQRSSIRIAVTSFPTLDGRFTDFSTYLAQQLNARLSQSSQFKVVEQSQTENILKQLGFDKTPTLKSADLFKVGAYLYAEGIILGNLSDLGSSVNINVRLVEVQMGEVLSQAVVEVPQSDLTDRLLGKNQPTQDTVFVQTERVVEKIIQVPVLAAPLKSPEPTIALSDTFFYENFSKYEEGDPASEWGKNLVIVEKEKVKYLTSQTPGEQVGGKTLPFPDDFRFQFDFLGRKEGAIKLIFVNEQEFENELPIILRGRNWANEIRVKIPGVNESDVKQKEDLNTIAVVKKGAIYKVFINNQFVVTGEYPKFARVTRFKVAFEDGRCFTGFVGRREK